MSTAFWADADAPPSNTMSSAPKARPVVRITCPPQSAAPDTIRSRRPVQSRAADASLLLRRSVEATGIDRLADNMAFHRLQQIVARGGGGQIELGIEREEFEDVV